MLTTNFKPWLGFARVLIFICGVWCLWCSHSAPAQTADPARPAGDGPPRTKDVNVKELLKERLAVLRELSDLTTKDYETGRGSFDRVHQAARAVLDAELELCESGKERLAILEKIVAQAKESEKTAEQRYKTGNAPRSDVLTATAARLEAEIALERAKSKVPARPTGEQPKP